MSKTEPTDVEPTPEQDYVDQIRDRTDREDDEKNAVIIELNGEHVGDHSHGDIFARETFDDGSSDVQAWTLDRAREFREALDDAIELLADAAEEED